MKKKDENNRTLSSVHWNKPGKPLWKNLRLGIIGAGRVGGNIAYWLSRKGWHIRTIFSRTTTSAQFAASAIPTGIAPDIEYVFRRCDVALLTVSDSAIVPVLEQVSELPDSRVRTLLHCSGAMPASIMGIAGMQYAKASMHPCTSIPKMDMRKNPFSGVVFGVEGDEFAVKMASRLIEDLNGISHLISTANKPLYHSAGVFGSNFVYVLAAVTEQILRDAGMSDELARKSATMYIKRSLENYIKLGLPEGMTGPMARGDRNTIVLHMDALKKTPYLPLYIEASRIAAEIAGNEELFEQLLLKSDE